MPFDKQKIAVATSDGHYFTTLEPFTYTAGDGTAYTVPAGSVTDGCSSPRVLWWFIAPFGYHRLRLVTIGGGCRTSLFIWLFANMSLMGRKLIDIAGRYFGRVIALGYSYTKRRWVCRCSCGNTTFIGGSSLRAGTIKSCGCLNSELAAARQYRHGGSTRPEYKVWLRMLGRCRNPDNKSYAHYGGRGIAVCDQWLDFAVFLRDMGHRPSLLYSIERLDVNGDYTPENCVWATIDEQANNKRNSRRVFYQGKSSTVAQWARQKGISQATLSHRLDRGWSAERAFNPPVLGTDRRGRLIVSRDYHPRKGRKLTNELAADLRRRVSQGETYSMIAKRFRLSVATISQVVNGVIWRTAAAGFKE